MVITPSLKSELILIKSDDQKEFYVAKKAIVSLIYEVLQALSFIKIIKQIKIWVENEISLQAYLQVVFKNNKENIIEKINHINKEVADKVFTWFNLNLFNIIVSYEC